MRQLISGMVAAFAVIAAGVAPAKACDTCSPCGYVSPCGGYVQPYVQPYAAYERLPDPEVQYHAAPIAPPQYYYVNQGPTYSGPGNFAPRPSYQEGGVYGWPHHHHHYGYGYRHYGYGYHAFHHYPWHHHHYGYRYGYRPHVLHSYY